MKKCMGQTFIEFLMIIALASIVIIGGLYLFSDELADFFAGNDQGKKFNNSRTVKFEDPQDLVSNISVTYDGLYIEPPVEKIIKAGLANGSYVQTSGSTGMIAEMGEIMAEYINQLKQLSAQMPTAQQAAFDNALDLYNDSIKNGTTGFVDRVNSFSDTDVLEKKLVVLEFVVAQNNSAFIGALNTAYIDYSASLPPGNGKTIIDTFANDLLGMGNLVDYFIDPSLYMKYLNEEKDPTDATQDTNLVNAMLGAVGGLTQDEKLSEAGLIKVYFGSGYSHVSPSAYNSERLCSSLNGLMVSETDCEVTAP